jgi:hypothetical protein
VVQARRKWRGAASLQRDVDEPQVDGWIGPRESHAAALVELLEGWQEAIALRDVVGCVAWRQPGPGERVSDKRADRAGAVTVLIGLLVDPTGGVIDPSRERPRGPERELDRAVERRE